MLDEKDYINGLRYLICFKILLNFSINKFRTKKFSLRTEVILMVLGLALLSWDEILGPIVDFKYPNHLNLSTDLVSKILMSHTLNEEVMEELFELEFNGKIILSYCNKSKIEETGHEILNYYFLT